MYHKGTITLQLLQCNCVAHMLKHIGIAQCLESLKCSQGGHNLGPWGESETLQGLSSTFSKILQRCLTSNDDYEVQKFNDFQDPLT